MSPPLPLLVFGALVGVAASAPRPNIVFIMADDLGWGEVGLYPSTSSHGRISTPHIDALGRSGLQFTNAYAGYTVCAPSRTALMTGYHSGHFDREGLPGITLPVTSQVPLLGTMLQKAGYTTAGIGKAAPLESPSTQGFDYFIGQTVQTHCHNMYPRYIDTGASQMNINLTRNWEIPSANAKEARAVTMANPANFNYTVDITHENSMKWVRQQAAVQKRTSASDRKPFFLYESFTVPHAGGWGYAPSFKEQGAPVPSDGQYADKSTWPNVEKDHAAVITYLDGYVGQMVSLLKELDIEKDTIVFFASDNGAHLEGGHDYRFFNSTGGLQGHKRSLFEGGVRSPTMISWPGTITPGISAYAWAFWDVMPTLGELSGGAIPSGIDGVSIVDTLMGKVQAPKEYLYWTWPGGKKAADHSALTALGWQAVQIADGTLAYRHLASGKEQKDSPVNQLASGKEQQDSPVNQQDSTVGAHNSGYGIRMGDWKGVVNHCADADAVPSSKDKYQVFHLPTDPFEANDVASTAAGKTQIHAFLKQLKTANVSCHCFQC